MDSVSSGSLQISVRTAIWGLDLKGVMDLKSMLSNMKTNRIPSQSDI